MDVNAILSAPKRGTSRRPDYVLKALNRATGQRTGKIGAAWRNEDGSISLSLDPGVQLHGEPDLVINLFPNDRGETEAAEKPARRKRGAATMADLPASVHHRL